MFDRSNNAMPTQDYKNIFHDTETGGWRIRYRSRWEPHTVMVGLVEVEMALVGQMEYQVLDSCSQMVEV